MTKVSTPLPHREGQGGGSIATIGFFDGVHRGHQFLIQQVRDEARRRGARSLLITFDRHPRAVFAPDSVPPLLTTADEKLALLRATGVDAIHILPFDREMAALTAREFMQQVLRNQLGVKVLVIGYDHHFGRPQSTFTAGSSTASAPPPEGFEQYRAYGRELGIEVVLAQELEGEHVSSSAIRRALESGDVQQAAHLLGHPYTWTGQVVHGHAVGRRLGFPTANLQALEPAKLLPANGAYAVQVSLVSPTPDANSASLNPHPSALIPQPSSLNETRLPAILNIGCRPTIDNGNDTSIEAHLLDYEGNLYGQTLTISFIARLRAEQRFTSEEELMHQLQQDKEAAAIILAQAQTNNINS